MWLNLGRLLMICVWAFLLLNLVHPSRRRCATLSTLRCSLWW